MVFLRDGKFSGFYHFFVILKSGVFCEMVLLVVFNSFNVVKNLKKPDLVARQKPPFYTTSCTLHIITRISMASMFEKNRSRIRVINRL